MPITVMPLLYQNGDFSSSFGDRFAYQLEEQLAQTPNGERAAGSAVVRGSYWVDEELVDVHLTVRSTTSGAVLASVGTTFPFAGMDILTLRPANVDSAFEDGRMLMDDRIVDGGIDIEVWTDRGRNERSLVFTEGEELQFYFKVNEPAFLQISYVLVTGETILLEESFYIGIDRVNRVVAYPYKFQVVPPFGVERLIVTAHSGEPPKPEVRPQELYGQWYEVFSSTEAVVAGTRGIARANQRQEGTGARVGEASLVVTTMRRGER